MFQHFGLREEPFGVTPDPRFAFFGYAHREAISSMYASILEGRGHALLIAHPGMGKTTMLNYLRARLGDSADVAALSNFAPTRTGLLHEVMTLLGFDWLEDDTAECWRRLQRFAYDRWRAGRRVVVLCDDAQSLSQEALEDIGLLTNCEVPEQKLIQIVLAGQPGIVPRLQTPRLEALCQKVGVVSHIQPLPGIEVEAYVQHRLQVAGAGREIFAPEALRAVGRVSNGIPLRINTICHAALVEAWLGDLECVGEVEVQTAAAELLDLAFPAQVAEIAPAPRRGTRSAAVVANDAGAPRRIVHLEPVGMESAAEAGARPASSRHFEKLQRMQRAGDLFETPAPAARTAEAAPVPAAPVVAAAPRRSTAGERPSPIAARLLERLPQEGTAAIGFATVNRRESAAVALALAGRELAAALGTRVLLVEASGGHSQLGALLDVPAAGPGLGDLLFSNDADIESTVQATGLPGVFVLRGAHDAHVLATRTALDVFAQLRGAFGALLLEMPAVKDANGTMGTFALADRIVLVAKPGESRVRDLEHAMRRLAAARVDVCGAIVDDIEVWRAPATPSAALRALRTFVEVWLGRARTAVRRWDPRQLRLVRITHD